MSGTAWEDLVEIEEKDAKQRKLAEWRKGSFTVEASLLLPLLLFVIFAFFCLSLYLHDRSVLASCAAELAGKGAARKYETEEHLESWLTGQAGGLAGEKLLLLRLTEVSADVTDSAVTVSYTGRTSLLGGLEAREEETAKRLNPVNFIRNIRRLQNLTGE